MSIYLIEVKFLVGAETSQDACGKLDTVLGGKYIRMEDPKIYSEKLDSFDTDNLIR